MWNCEFKQRQNGEYLKMGTYLWISICSNVISKKDIDLLSPIKNGSMCSIKFSCQESYFITITSNLFSLSVFYYTVGVFYVYWKSTDGSNSIAGDKILFYIRAGYYKIMW
jgi:hypothetical protein